MAWQNYSKSWHPHFSATEIVLMITNAPEMLTVLAQSVDCIYSAAILRSDHVRFSYSHML